MAKRTRKKESEATISVCDIMKNNTSRIIKKLEMQVPITIQMYSDYYRSYLHSMDDVFGTCLIAEKHLLDKMGVDQRVLKNFQKYANDITSIIETQIEVLNNMQKAQLTMRSQMVKAYEYYIHYLMECYEEYLTTLNTNLKSPSS